MPPQGQPNQRQRPGTSGYRALGSLMGEYPDIAIFRRYRSVAALDLLYQQASLHRAIKSWTLIVEDDEKIPDRRQFDFSFERLEDSVEPNATTGAGAQWRHWCEVSQKLDRYYDKMLRFQKICSLAKVDKVQLRSLREFLSNRDGGDTFLEGFEEDLYEAPTPNDAFSDADLISIAHADEPDWFTGLARGPFSSFLHKLGRRNRSGRILRPPRLGGDGHLDFRLTEHSDESIQKLSRSLYAGLTSLLILFAILTLNFFQDFVGRTLLILSHNLLFTLGMAFLTHVKPVELFAAAAAYAAVLIVFASGPFGLTGPTTTN